MHLKGVSNREIARQLHKSKDTVNSYVREYEDKRRALLAEGHEIDKDEIIQSFVEKPRYDVSERGPTKMTEEVVSLIRRCLDENTRKRASGMAKQQMKKIDIHAYLKDQGYDVSYSSVKRKVAELEKETREAFIRQSYKPGEICEFDWGTVKLNIGNTGYRKYQMAAFTSADGNYRYSRLYHSQDMAAFQESHADFFEHCGGVFHEMVYDNMRVAVKQFVGPSEKEPTEGLLQISAYYGFRFRFCNIASGNEKGHVERSVEYIRRKAFCRPGDDIFDTLAAANRFLADKCAEINRSAISDGTVPAVTMEEEKKHLLPIVPKFDCCIRRTVNVDKYATVVYGQNHYSVPDDLVGETLKLRAYTDRICIYNDDKKLAEHARSFRCHSWTLDIYHYLRTLRQKPGALPGSTAMLQSDARIKDIYETYYTDNPKAFLDTLILIRERGSSAVLKALRQLERLSPTDLSADKVRMICDKQADEGRNAVGTDRISIATQQSLSNYNLLMKAQNERIAV